MLGMPGRALLTIELTADADPAMSAGEAARIRCHGGITTVSSTICFIQLVWGSNIIIVLARN